MPSLIDVRETLHLKQSEMATIMREAGQDHGDLDMDRVTFISGTSESKVAEIKRRNDEMAGLGQELDRLSLVESIGLQNEMRRKEHAEPAPNGRMQHAAGPGSEPRIYLPGQLKAAIQEHKGYRQFREGTLRSVSMDFPSADFKTLVTLTTVNRQASRRDSIVNMALEERTVADLMLQGQTDGNTVEYYEETTFTNNAASVAEAAAKPESALGYTLRTEAIRKIAHWIPATKEAMDDVPFLESQIRGRLAFGVLREEERQLLAGDGTAPNISGILDRTDIQTQAKGVDPTPDAIYRAMQKVRGAGGLGFAEPSAVVMHPNDWTDIKLLRTADGIYLWGNPSDEGPDRIWGLPVRITTAMTENTALVGAFRPYAEVLRREGITITLSTEHASYFTENKVAVLAESRLGLAVYRPSAFCTVTGI